MGINVFAVSRAIWDHEMFDREAFTEREAWMWLISEAAWKPTKVRVGTLRVELGRGQLAHSVRFMADKWGWSKSRVDRFLNRLKTGTLIETAAGQGVNVITICKYSEYQKVGLPSGTQTEPASGTAAGQQRDREETGETIKQDNNPSGRETAPVISMPAKSSDAQVYALGRKVLGNSAGGLITRLRKECQYDDVLATEILTGAAEKDDPKAWVAKCIASLKDRAYWSVPGVDTGPRFETEEDREWKRREAEIYRNVH
jgi:hypothetical protein